MSTESNSLAAFYCPVHQLRFHATPAEVVECDQTSHAVGYGFPSESLWIYCCACGTFSPHEPAGNHLQLTSCPVCEREVGKRCLCYSCQVLTIESVINVHRKIHSIDPNGVNPTCPGCGSPPSQPVVQHDCSELGLSFLSARHSCLFCELPIADRNGAKQNEALCDDRTSPAQTETAELDQESFLESIDEPTEPEDYGSSWSYSVVSTPTKRRTPWLIGGAAALVSLVILIAVAMTNSNRTRRGPETETRIPDAPPGMVYIAGGDFMMGSNAGDEYERPAHRVSVAPFFIDATEVTCEDYLKFLKGTARKDPQHWTRRTCQSGRQPVTGVDWNDAKAYADWANKRLPTEAEWEFATRGVLSTLYPWGNEWKPNAANAGNSSAQRLMEVGSFPGGKTPTGVMDLIGNAWEWTSSDLVIFPGGVLSTPIPPDVKVVRGGSWQAGKQATGTYRGFLHITNAKDYSATGFRCVKDIGPDLVVAKP